MLEKIIGGSVGEIATKIISLFKLDPAIAVQHEKEMAQIAAEAAAKVQDAATAEIEAASANIRADAATGDKYTQRARPTFMYFVMVVLGCNYVIFPIFKIATIDLPQSLYWLFGSAVLGYTGARTWEKFMLTDGESTFQAPFGFKASQTKNGSK